MPFFPQVASGELGPLFRLLDDYASPKTASCRPATGLDCSTKAMHYQPRFDVQEFQDHYELHGELPGVAQNDVDIEFTDAQTLRISGHSQRKPTNSEPAQPETSSTVAETHKPTVEDEDGQDKSSETSWTPVATPASTPVPAVSVDSTPAVAPVTQHDHHKGRKRSQSSRYWLSERNVGQFQRAFSFSDRVDADNVTANLRDGILSVVVPKAPTPVRRRINIA